MNLQNSARARKLSARREDNQFGKSKFHIHNMQISDYRYLENVFKNPWKRLNLAQDAPHIGIQALKTNVLIWDFMSTTMKGAIHKGQNYNDNFDVHMYTNFEGSQNLLHITQKLVLHHQVVILNVKTIEWTSLSWTRSTLSHDQVTKWKSESTRILRFRLMLGENVRSFRSKSKM